MKKISAESAAEITRSLKIISATRLLVGGSRGVQLTTNMFGRPEGLDEDWVVEACPSATVLEYNTLVSEIEDRMIASCSLYSGRA